MMRWSDKSYLKSQLRKQRWAYRKKHFLEEINQQNRKRKERNKS